MASQDETASLLKRTPLFSGLSPAELDELAQVAVPRTYEVGQVVFREGDQGDTCFVVRFGAVKITREHGGRTIALAELRAGDTFGELSMFGGEVRSATAQALEPTAAVALLAGDIRRLLDQEARVLRTQFGSEIDVREAGEIMNQRRDPKCASAVHRVRRLRRKKHNRADLHGRAIS